MNMLATIVPKSDQINADDLIGKTMTITVTGVKFSGGQEQPVSMYFEGSEKAFRPCKSMCRVLVAAWGPDAKEYVGRSMTLYRDPKVKWGGMEVGGIRISHMSHLDNAMTMALAETRASRKPFTVKPLQIEQRQQSDASKTKQTAAEWADDHIAFVVGAASTERLAAVQESGKKAMAKLEAGDPDLHAKVLAAYAKRLNELAPIDGDGQFEPQQGRADADHGDQFSGDDTGENLG